MGRKADQLAKEMTQKWYCASVITKKCLMCGEEKPATTEFWHQQKSGGLGLNPRCKVCRTALARARNSSASDEQRDLRRSRQRAAYAQDPERYKKKRAAWRAKNPDKDQAIRKKYRATRPGFAEKHRAEARLYAQRPERKAHVRAYQIANKPDPERVRVARRKWEAANPDSVAATKSRRRARLRGGGGSHTAQDVQKQFAAQDGLCYWRGPNCVPVLKKGGKGKMHVDHIIPIALMGTDNADNICCSCPNCNHSKGPKMPYEFNGRLI